MINKMSIVAFLLGVASSVAVYELVSSSDENNRASRRADSPRTALGAATSDASRIAQSPTRTALPAPLQGSREVAHLREVADGLRARTTAAEEQLELAEGRSIPWPADVRAAYKRDAVERQLKEFIVDRGLGTIKDIDCSEYPCVGVLEIANTGPLEMSSLNESLREMIKRYYEGPVALMISNSQSGDGANLATVSILPDEEDVKIRTRHRANEAMRGHAP